MTNVIVIGNSHVGALKKGWDCAGSRYPGYEVEFFAAPAGRPYSSMRLAPNLVYGLPDTSSEEADDDHVGRIVRKINGAETINLKPADVVVWAGYRWPSESIAALLSDFDVDELRETGAKQRLSKPFFKAALGDLATSALPAPCWQRWNAPPALFLSTKPLPAASVAEINPKGPWSEVLREPQGVAETFQLFFAALGERLAALDIGLVTPPRSTQLPNGFTRPEFTRGSQRLTDKAHPDEEVSHMNAQYGVNWFEEFFAMLDGAEAPKSLALCS